MKFDMHCHTHEGSFDSKVSIKEYIELLKAQGFDGMLVTDHNSYRGYNYYKKELESSIKEFVVLKGIEYDTLNAGHFIVVVPSKVKLPILECKGLPIEILIKIVHYYGGILSPAHPSGEPFLSVFSTGIFKRNSDIAKKFDFIEVFNSGEDPCANDKSYEIACKYNKPITGGSDAHRSDCVGLAYTIFDEDIFSEDELINYIKSGKPTRCGGDKYLGTIKEHLGIFNKILVYGFFPYNKFGAMKHRKKRKSELNNISKELKDRIEQIIHPGA